MSDHGKQRRVRLDRLTIPANSLWNRLPLIGGVIGVLACAATFALGRSDPARLYHSWLVAFLFFLSIALGGLFFVLVHYCTKAGWGVAVRRLAENTMATLPLFILLFVPIYLGMHDLFQWMDAEAVAGDHLLTHKAPFLNQGFFLARAAFYLICWTLLSLVFLRGSVKQDTTGDHAITRRLTALSGPGIIFFAVTVSFAAIDWCMTLDAHWYSTIYGVYYFAGCLVGFFALLALLATLLTRSGYLSEAVTTEHFHDLGKLLFAFTVFWTYIAFSQYFLIWYANIPEETAWVAHRSEGSWGSVSILLGVGHFALPFLYLMSRNIKRRTTLLSIGAVWMLLMHLVDIYWLVMPNLDPHGVHVSLLDVTSLLGIGGLFVAALAGVTRRHALVPVKDPRLVESLSFQNF